MRNQHIIDCYKLDLIKDIPKELQYTTAQRDSLFSENQKLKNIIWALGISCGCLIIYNIIKNYGKKQRHPQEKTTSKKHQTEYQYNQKNSTRK